MAGGIKAMNKTQKGGCFILGTNALFLAFVIDVLIKMFSIEKPKPTWLLLWGSLILGYMIISLIIVFRKQNPAEVESDERDSLIKKKAVSVSFVAVWPLLVVAGFIATRIVGDDGSIPVSLLPIIHIGVFLVIMLIYPAAILVQYGLGGKNGSQ